ncbi:hypothetical protein [Streptacidiphilus carbonis]|uniref:hypothetical protein n=1 Tax=Streptacidiphilus carbonis TaxID=105422 RepID=UPI00126A0A16|nr:hypothetical protein [Streptacidiphilus carbonis]
MRTILDTVIQAQRGAERQTVDVARLERVRREMGQQHRGDFKECTRSPGSFSICAGYSQVREVLAVTSIGHPDAGAVHRLAGELADVVASATKGRQLEWEAERGAVPAQPVDGGRHERADSERTERGTR